MTKIRILYHALAKMVWPKVTFFTLLAFVSAFVAFFLHDRIPDDFAYSVDRQTIGSILNILASSMLAVTTFSLTVMVQAYSSASTGVTPRATQLVVQDHTAQNVLATFLGTFVFSLVSIIALNTGIYRDKGRIILFVMTLAVIAIIIITIIRWIAKLTRIGRVAETTRLVEKAAKDSITDRASSPCLGCNRMEVDLPDTDDLTPLNDDKYGYVQYVDVEKLSALAEKHWMDIYVNAMPGAFVFPQMPYMWSTKPVPEKEKALLLKAFKIADERAFEQDPRYGVCVLSEIAQRAVAQMTDSGTVIDVLGRLVSVLAVYAKTTECEVNYKRVWVPALEVSDMFHDAFNVIARDSAHLFEVQARLQKCLGYLAAIDNEEFTVQAKRFSRIALQRALRTDMLAYEKEELERLALQ